VFTICVIQLMHKQPNYNY